MNRVPSEQSLKQEYYLPGYNDVQSAESQPTFWRNMSPPSSGSKKNANEETKVKQAASKSFEA
jgi:hypothetical protein